MVMIAPYRLIISPETWGDLIVNNEYPPDDRFKIEIAHPQLIKTKETSFSFQSFAGLDYFFELWTFSVGKAGSVSMKVEQAFVVMVVCLKVDKRPFVEDMEEMSGKRYSLCYFPQGIYNIHLPQGDTTLLMTIPPLYHLHSMAMEHPAVKEIYNHLQFNGNTKILLSELPLPQTVLHITKLLQQSEERGASLDHSIRSYMLQLLSLYNKQLRIITGTTHHFHAERQKIQPLIKYIHEHLTDDRLNNTNIIAQIFGLSVIDIRKDFKLVTGKTIERYIRDERLIHAKQLLEQTDMSVGEIAGMIGYSSDSNFARAYRKLFGQAPADRK